MVWLKEGTAIHREGLDVIRISLSLFTLIDSEPESRKIIVISLPKCQQPAMCNSFFASVSSAIEDYCITLFA